MNKDEGRRATAGVHAGRRFPAHDAVDVGEAR
jgi:hypothetical protein